jgi:hypothetical protein
VTGYLSREPFAVSGYGRDIMRLLSRHSNPVISLLTRNRNKDFFPLIFTILKPEFTALALRGIMSGFVQEAMNKGMDA